jgi:hypothetical protein
LFNCSNFESEIKFSRNIWTQKQLKSCGRDNAHGSLIMCHYRLPIRFGDGFTLMNKMHFTQLNLCNKILNSNKHFNSNWCWRICHHAEMDTRSSTWQNMWKFFNFMDVSFLISKEIWWLESHSLNHQRTFKLILIDLNCVIKWSLTDLVSEIIWSFAESNYHFDHFFFFLHAWHFQFNIKQANVEVCKCWFRADSNVSFWNTLIILKIRFKWSINSYNNLNIFEKFRSQPK